MRRQRNLFQIKQKRENPEKRNETDTQFTSSENLIMLTELGKITDEHSVNSNKGLESKKEPVRTKEYDKRKYTRRN